VRPDSFLRSCAFVIALTLLGVGSAWAAPTWNELNNRQQALIKPSLQSEGGDFDSLSEPRRAALVKGADRWLAMTAEQRIVATEQFQQWRRLSTAEKLAVLDRRDRFRKMGPDQRKALLDTHKQFLESSLQRQQELRDIFNRLPVPTTSLPSQPFGTPQPPTPGAQPPLGLPGTVFPSNTFTLPNILPGPR